MTRTQLKGMRTRELLEHTRRVACPHETTGDLLLELADRLDAYPFNPEPHPAEQQELQA